eukprot:scaffold98900_cov66-Phaeocystis_antarctica.AAC.2
MARRPACLQWRLAACSTIVHGTAPHHAAGGVMLPAACAAYLGRVVPRACAELRSVVSIRGGGVFSI